ncbi:Zn-dependent protease [Devosia pacifica]|uniref:Zn-dependent protease n=1 Tax=Devosia pacifica TaxID=1335967 RepID=A0A918VTL4_9HYPH|nr:metallopeptidase family protein [Devosia pacifica]GHA24246.1 Zn-dependent protease [Devosia pacifica]
MNAWSGRQAPSLEDFEEMALAALEGLPAPFRDLAREVTCVVADFAEDEVLEEMQMDSPFELMGLFVGIGMAHDGAAPVTGQMPNQVFLYRRPILDYWAENEDTLSDVITHVLIHEIGHHFGFSDDDMEAIEADAETEH